MGFGHSCCRNLREMLHTSPGMARIVWDPQAEADYRAWESDNQTPAEWWDESLGIATTARAEAVKNALSRLNRDGCSRGEILTYLWRMSGAAQLPLPLPRRQIEQFRNSARKVSDQLYDIT